MHIDVGLQEAEATPPPTPRLPDDPASVRVMHRTMNLKKHLRSGNNDDKKPQIGLVWP